MLKAFESLIGPWAPSLSDCSVAARSAAPQPRGSATAFADPDGHTWTVSERPHATESDGQTAVALPSPRTGALDRNRTCDLPLRRRSLYPLSYEGRSQSVGDRVPRRLRNAVETVSANHLESHLTCSASVFSSSGLVEHHAVARSRWTSGWTTSPSPTHRPSTSTRLRPALRRGRCSEQIHRGLRREAVPGDVTVQMSSSRVALAARDTQTIMVWFAAFSDGVSTWSR